jgi:hypothetical protein
MADKKISELTAAAALAGTEAVPIVQGGETVKTTAQDIADLAAATPGGSTTEIQFNNAGAFDGDPDFTWVGGAALTSGVGLTNKRLAAFGNFADLADATFAPGDVTNGFSVGAPFPLAVNNFWSGDLSAHPWENTDILSYNGYEHTGVGNAFLFSLDISPVINGDSTGPFSAAAGVYGSINNYGSGNIGSMFGLQYAAAHYGSGTVATLAAADLFLAGSGDATNAFGARVRTPFDGSGFVNLYGLLVQDQSGIGSALSLNILSEGDGTSLNVFEGSVQVGAATEAAGVVTPGTGPNVLAVGNYAVPGFVTFAPGDPVNESSYAEVGVVGIQAYLVGDLSGGYYGGETNFVGVKHTGATALEFLFGHDVEWTINSDSTGDVTYYDGLSFYLANYGSGDIAFMFGFVGQAVHAGSGTVAELYGGSAEATPQGETTLAAGMRVLNRVNADSVVGDLFGYLAKTPETDGMFTVTNNYGLYIEDQSGIGSATSYNILSEGATSNNVFEGTVTVGKASGNTGDIKFIGTTSGTVTLTTADAAGTWTMKLPSTDGNAGEVLKTDGSGVTSWAPFASPAPVVLTDGATPALDASLGSVFTLSAAGDRTIAVPSNATSGQRIVIAHTASGGARTLALNTGAGGFRFGSDITALTATVDTKTDYIECIYNSGASKWDVITYVKGY